MAKFVDKVLGLAQPEPPAAKPRRQVKPAAKRKRELQFVESVTCAFCRGSGKDACGGTCGVCKGDRRIAAKPPVVWCLKCRGTGRENGTLTCLACRGVGWVSVPEGAGTCPHCHGTGKEGVFYCIHCHGQGIC